MKQVLTILFALIFFNCAANDSTRITKTEGVVRYYLYNGTQFEMKQVFATELVYDTLTYQLVSCPENENTRILIDMICYGWRVDKSRAQVLLKSGIIFPMDKWYEFIPLSKMIKNIL